MLFLLLDLGLACLLDRLFGDPPRLPHPVNAIGALITRLEKAWHPGARATPRRQYAAGLGAAALVMTAAFAAVLGSLCLAALVHPVLFHALNVYWIFAALAARCLDQEARKVERRLKRDELGAARLALAGLVSREVAKLDADGVARATVETVAENTVDGVLSPLFCLAAGYGLAALLLALWPGSWPFAAGLGAAFAWFFKGASTLDSRIAYKTERYLHFGRAAARTDDALNFLPARLSLGLIPLAAGSLGLDARASWRIGRRDRRKHASPNSAHPEAAVAGALGIGLGGPAFYGGALEDKPWLGDPRRPVAADDIGAAVRLMYRSALLFVAAAGLGLALAAWRLGVLGGPA